MEHRRALAQAKGLIEAKPVVLDRGFRGEGFFHEFVAEAMKLPVRLNISNHPTLRNEEGQEVVLSVTPGERVFHRGLYYKGKGEVNVAGEWQAGFSEPFGPGAGGGLRDLPGAAEDRGGLR